MSNLESDNSRLLVLANLSDVEDNAAKYWDQWMSRNSIGEITGTCLPLASSLYRKWPDSSLMDFDPRVKGNAKRSYYQNVNILSAIEEIDLSFTEKGVEHCWLRSSAMLRYNYGSPKSVFVSHLEMLCRFKGIEKSIELLKNLGWRIKEKSRNKCALVNQNGLELFLFQVVSPHWSQRMHHDLLRFIQLDSTGAGVLVELLSQVQLARDNTDWLRIFESMYLMRFLANVDMWRMLQNLANDFLVLSPLANLSKNWTEVDVKGFGMDTEPSSQELNMHAAYEMYVMNRSLSGKLRYHISRFQAINSVADVDTSILEYISNTRDMRRT